MSGAADFFKNLQTNVRKLELDIAQHVVKVKADYFYAQHFNKEHFRGKQTTQWADRKKKETPRRALLVKSGHLKKKASHGVRRGKNILYQLPIYGKYHNEGTDKHPQRKFIGESEVLDERIRKKAIQILNKRLKGL